MVYDAAAQQVEYSGILPAGFACIIQIPVRVNTSQIMAITNSATIDHGQLPTTSVAATVILNGFDTSLPIILNSG